MHDLQMHDTLATPTDSLSAKGTNTTFLTTYTVSCVNLPMERKVGRTQMKERSNIWLEWWVNNLFRRFYWPLESTKLSNLPSLMPSKMTIRVQRAVKVAFVDTIQVKWAVVDAILFAIQEVKWAFKFAICWAIEVKRVIGMDNNTINVYPSLDDFQI
jgi:hypothetical protein